MRRRVAATAVRPASAKSQIPTPSSQENRRARRPADWKSPTGRATQSAGCGRGVPGRPGARRPAWRPFLLALILASVGAAGHADDLLLPRDRPGTVTSTRREGLVCFDGKREELVASAGWRIEPGPAGPPAAIAWILPVPAAPDAVALAPARLFPELAELARVLELEQVIRSPEPEADRVRRIGGDALSTGPDEAVACRCDLQPLADAVELQAWLAREGFAAAADEDLAIYVSRSWKFVAVRIRAPEGRPALDLTGSIPPVRLSFAASVPVFPARLATGDAPFDLTVYWMTRARPAYDNRRDRPLPMDLVLRLPPEQRGRGLPELFDALGREAKLDPRGLRFLLRTSREGVNGPRHPVAKWEADPTIGFE